MDPVTTTDPSERRDLALARQRLALDKGERWTTTAQRILFLANEEALAFLALHVAAVPS